MKKSVIFVALATGAILAPVANAKVTAELQQATVKRGSVAFVNVRTSQPNRTWIGLIPLAQVGQFEAGEGAKVESLTKMSSWPVGMHHPASTPYLVTLSTRNLRPGRYVLVAWERTTTGTWGRLVPARYMPPGTREILRVFA